MAIEAQQFTEKDELIAKFYTLRAGLSAIAEENKEIKSVESQLWNYQRKENSHKNEIQKLYEKEELHIYQKKRGLERDLENVQHLYNSKEAELSKAKSKLNELNKPGAYQKYRPSLGCAVYSFYLVIGFIIFIFLLAAFMISPLANSFKKYEDIIGILGGISGIILTIFVIESIKKAKAKKELNKVAFGCTKNVSKIEKELLQYKSQMEEITNIRTN